jgi:hypothetical protein
VSRRRLYDIANVFVRIEYIGKTANFDDFVCLVSTLSTGTACDIL